MFSSKLIATANCQQYVMERSLSTVTTADYTKSIIQAST